MPEGVQQIAVWLKDIVRDIAKLSAALATQGINIESMVLTEAGGYGIVRFVVREPAQACRHLEDAGFTVRANEILVFEVDDRPGQLATLSRRLDGVGVEYLYGFPFRHRASDRSVNLIFVDVADIESAKRAALGSGDRDIRSIDLAGLERIGFFAEPRATPPPQSEAP
jgi:hypothetical protein